MTFTVFKCGMDGVCGGNHGQSIQEAMAEILNYDGWDSLTQLRDRIYQWGINAKPGQAFRTKYSVIVCESVSGVSDGECDECLSEDLEYEELNCEAGNRVVQIVTCNECGHRWQDVFTLAERNSLANAE